MYPTAISLIIEHILKIVLYLLLITKIKDDNIISFVFILYFLCYLSSFMILIIFAYNIRTKEYKRFSVYKTLFKLCIPFGIATLFFTLYQFIDTVTLSILLPVEGYYTAFMFENIRLIFFPIVIAQALGGMLNPKINYLYKENKQEEVNELALKCTNLIINILIPLTIIMKLFSNEILII